MNPAQANKVDLSQLTEQEQKLFRMYGKLPVRKDLLGHKLKERKYFDSGDYALSKAGKEPLAIGSEHPSPASIPHTCPSNNNFVTSPVRESPLAPESKTTKEEEEEEEEGN
ncbi:camp-regulated phosphoprotein/endosulfine conserved region-domain-containing protein [Phycomyces nitens]|nr:camp-regulated phosphoprotein/endosulfine conserved region-domain-containing protein [Phycomyces nitens]